MAAYPTLPAWNQPPTEWLSLQQAAVNYGISVDTLRRRIAHGQLPASRFGEDSSESAPETSTDSSDRSQQSTRPFEKHGDGSGPPPFEPWRGSDSLRKWSSARRPGGHPLRPGTVRGDSSFPAAQRRLRRLRPPRPPHRRQGQAP